MRISSWSCGKDFVCYFVKYSRMWQRGSGEWILIPNKISIELLVEEVNMLSVEQTSKSIRWNLRKMPIHWKVLCEKISKWNCGGGCSLASNRSWEVTFKWERWVFAIPQSAKQTGAICAQKLVLISTCLSDVLRRDARQPPQLALGFVNHSACAKFTYLYLWIYLAHDTNSQYCILMKALHWTCSMDSGCYFVHFSHAAATVPG